jgi:hypothetical protein
VVQFWVELKACKWSYYGQTHSPRLK